MLPLELPLLVMAIANVESGLDPKKVGKNGEIGICQISPATFEYIRLCGKRYLPSRARTCELEDMVDSNLNMLYASAYLQMMVFRMKDLKCPDWTWRNIYILAAVYHRGLAYVIRRRFDINRFDTSVISYCERVGNMYEELYNAKYGELKEIMEEKK